MFNKNGESIECPSFKYGYRVPVTIPSLTKRTVPILDMFWVCGRKGMVMQVLPEGLSECCTWKRKCDASVVRRLVRV